MVYGLKAGHAAREIEIRAEGSHDLVDNNDVLGNATLNGFQRLADMMRVFEIDIGGTTGKQIKTLGGDCPLRHVL
ncbi:MULTISPECIES: hypothetical protein [Gammaproteobacteria]|uniref:hypothetical protein n=1 Tax=Gammaproteobacteria TaxID=1236 RepID=UPI001ADAE8AB|nr:MULTISPECIES: hypothetical protein [Gammaproteobacteria]MBO9481515.1 hypothetical protein [Salinisphaera sp. G21_0]MBO9493986.1 hypothetical protein [Thalassotalea sp. G20_0]